MNSSCGLLDGIMWLKTDVLRLPISPIFKDQAVREQDLLLKMEPKCSPETSDLKHHTPRNNPENARNQKFNSCFGCNCVIYASKHKSKQQISFISSC
jgi:hypothetical protein